MTVPEPSRRIGSLFGAGALAITFLGAGDPMTLLPSERECAKTFGSARISEYAAGRACARIALERFGYENFALISQADRRPRWPDDIVGSITHSGRHSGAVVAHADTFAAIGLDVEQRGRVGRELWSHLFTTCERDRLARAADADLLATIFFSAKEAFYKCRFTKTESWLDFLDVSVDVEPPDAMGKGTYVARLVEPDRFTDFNVLQGRYAIDPHVVWTGIAVSSQNDYTSSAERESDKR